ncbi:hypothetical protein C1645_803934 [Glomus cerebriforme]|uniref:Transmembrane protein n=1 Tax=Glomus cerebriforme TaxID=658196 RepID=A0A397TBL6_9GLOM|nr:hypothetical protein C1645_803934 [Glomus cerebriforme]
MSLKHSLLKKWQRVTESRYTKAFVIISIIQTIVLVYLQIRILYRNAILFLSVGDDECPLVIITFALLIFENIVFVLFDLFQLYFCMNGIFHQNLIQIFVTVIIDVGYVIIGIIQLIEVKLDISKIESTCPTLHLSENIILYELPHILVLVVLTISMAVLSRKLYRELDWDIYKKIGGDIEIRKIYKTILIFEMLLKINLFFVLIYNTLTAPFAIYELIKIYNKINTVQKALNIGCLAIVILVFFFQPLAYISMKKEWKAGMIIFIIFWFIALVDICFLALIFEMKIVRYRFYSWTLLLCISIICALLTFIYAIIVTKNFGKGLKEYLNKHEDKDSDKKLNVKNIESGLDINKKFTIDD